MRATATTWWGRLKCRMGWHLWYRTGTRQTVIPTENALLIKHSEGAELCSLRKEIEALRSAHARNCYTIANGAERHCTCGAFAWNEPLDAVLAKFPPTPNEKEKAHDDV